MNKPPPVPTSLPNDQPSDRCRIHHLVMADDGLCVLCRREKGMPLASIHLPDPDFEKKASPPWGALLLIFAALALFLAVTYSLVHMRNQRELDELKQKSQGTTPATDNEATATDQMSGETVRLHKNRNSNRRGKIDDGEILRRGKARPLLRIVGRLDGGNSQSTILDASAQTLAEEKETLARRRAINERYERAQLNQALRTVRIVMYATKWCEVCKRAREWFKNTNLPYEEIDIDADRAAAQKLREINPRGSVPTFLIDEDVHSGFSAYGLTQAIKRAAQKKVTP